MTRWVDGRLFGKMNMMSAVAESSDLEGPADGNTAATRAPVELAPGVMDYRTVAGTADKWLLAR